MYSRPFDPDLQSVGMLMSQVISRGAKDELNLLLKMYTWGYMIDAALVHGHGAPAPSARGLPAHCARREGVAHSGGAVQAVVAAGFCGSKFRERRAQSQSSRASLRGATNRLLDPVTVDRRPGRY